MGSNRNRPADRGPADRAGQASGRAPGRASAAPRRRPGAPPPLTPTSARRVFLVAALITLIGYGVLAHSLLHAAAPSTPALAPELFNPLQLVGLLALVLVVTSGLTANLAMVLSASFVVGFLAIVFLVAWRLARIVAAGPPRR
jgi:hypothetical protein